MRSILSNQEVRGLCLAYTGIGAFFGTLLVGIHPLVPFLGGAAVALMGLYVFAEGRSDRFRITKGAPRDTAGSV